VPPQPHYRRIAQEIGGRIRGGRLRPGQRIPSTRQIMREWGVAMATATRVIQALADEGLVRARPGAGTVVADPGERVVAPPRPEEALSRERVVRTSVGLADSDGLAAVSMRRVATALGVTTMAVYRHVPGKEDLVRRMAECVFADHPLPGWLPPDTRERLASLANHLWGVFRRHPWAAQALSATRPQMIPSLLPFTEEVLAAAAARGADTTEMMHVLLTVFGYVRGTALAMAAEVQAEQDTGLTADEWAQTAPAITELSAVLASGRFPTLARVAREGFPYDVDRVFSYGLNRVLDGLDTALGAPSTRRGAAG
jgi:DNA-binding transcriptional regulator YhcF (GntR family)